MILSQNELSCYLAKYLNIANIKDSCVNGLQVQGCEDIKTILTAVTASQDALNFAVTNNAQTIIVHHGYFWDKENPVITGIKYNRIKTLLLNNISLFAYHLPLDVHKFIGNNILLAKKLPLTNIQFYESLNVPDLLCIGEFNKKYVVTDIKNILADILNRVPQIVSNNNIANKIIKKIAICTGAAADVIHCAKKLGADALITGEISERTYYESQELDIVVFAAGHHATETFGVHALGEHLANKYNINHIFYDSNNPL